MKTKILLIVFIAIISSTVSAQKSIICTSTSYKESLSFDTASFGIVHCIADNYSLWDNGKTLYISFFNGSISLQQKVKAIAKEWEKVANIKFQFIENGNSHIRIKFTNDGFINTAQGTYCLIHPQDEPTALIDTSTINNPAVFKGIVLHLFGHIIGLTDEISLPKEGIKWNNKGLQKIFPDKSNKTQFQDKYFSNQLLNFKYDSYSIMATVLPKSLATNYEIKKWNDKISENDKKLMAVLYPKKSRKYDSILFVKPSILFHGLNVVNNRYRKGISFYPSISLADTNRTNAVMFFIVLVDKDGKPIMQNGEDYSISKQVGKHIPNRFGFYSVNKINNKSNSDLELFIPYTAIQKNKIYNGVFAIFKVYYKNNDNEGWLYESEKFEVKL
jgi:hypothetical protein